MRSGALLLSLLALTFTPAVVSAAGPVLGGGLVETKLTHGGDERYGGLAGGAYKIAFEIGSHHFRNEFGLNQSFFKGNGGGFDHDLRLTGFSYQLSFLLFERGLSPYVGAGIETGAAVMKESGIDAGGVWHTVREGAYLRPYGIAGLRFQFGRGLGLRAEVTASSYGEFVSLSENLGVSYTW